MKRLCIGTLMSILYQARNQKVTNNLLCDAIFSSYAQSIELRDGSLPGHLKSGRENVPPDVIDAAIEEGIAKFGGKKPNKAAIKLPLRDGDVERDDEAYKGHYFINANSKTAPQIVDKSVKPILDRSEVYSGCYGRVSLNFYAFNSNGNKGVACGLGNIQKIRDGEPLGGKTSAVDDFTTLVDDDFLA